MTDRVKRLLQEVRNTNAPVCTKKFEIASEVLKANRDASPWFKRVLPLAAFYDQMPLFIPEGQLIVGEGASKPYGIELCYEQGIWTEQQLDEMHGENATWCHLEDDDYEFCRRYNADPDKVVSKPLAYHQAHYVFNDPAVAAVQTSLGGWTDKESGIQGSVYGVSSMGNFPNMILAIPHYEMILNEGARSIINRCKEHLANVKYAEAEALDKIDFWEGIIIVYEAWIRFSNRYADLAEKMSAESSDPVRAAELKQISETCRRVPEYPARTFREAMQAFWFVWISIVSPTVAAGRFDQYMYPFYKADLEAGRITADEALELLELLKIKTQACRTVRGSLVRAASSGGASWYNFTIGGVDKDGNDATNELTYLMLEATRETLLPNHTLTLRVHEGTPPLLMQKALELVKTGIGMPAFVSDREYIKFFLAHGVSLDDARNYGITGCLDGNIPGKTRMITNSFVGNMQILDIFLHNGYSRFNSHMAGIETGDVRGFKSFEDFMTAFYKQHKYLVQRTADIMNITANVNRRYNKDPFFSSLMEHSIEYGKECNDYKIGNFDNFIMMSMVGAINMCDALAAIKKLVYDDKKYTMDQLIAALDADWEGYEDMRQDFKDAPKYGNDDDYVDSIVADYYSHFADDYESCSHAYGHDIVAGISITFHQLECRHTYASADGRKYGELLTDGSVSPEHGCDTNGPLAVLMSAMKIDQSKYNATLLNLKFHPTALNTSEDLMKLASMTKTYLTNGGKHVQFNVVDRETLIKAQQHPEQYRDLIVRVAGYSTYFTALTKLVQDEVIERTGFQQV